MSPLFVSAESRERDALGDPGRRKAYAKRLFSLAEQIEEFLQERTEDLNFGEYDDLREYETKLLAFGNLLSVSRASEFLEEELRIADDHFAYIRQRISKSTGC